MDPKCIKWLYVYGDDIYGLPIASNCSITLSSTSATSIPYRIPGKSILSQMISTTPTPTPTPTNPAFPHWKHHIIFLISNPDLSNSCQIISNNCDNSMSYLPHSISSAKISVRIVTPISISQHTLYHSLFRLPDINHNREGGKCNPPSTHYSYPFYCIEPHPIENSPHSHHTASELISALYPHIQPPSSGPKAPPSPPYYMLLLYPELPNYTPLSLLSPPQESHPVYKLPS